MNSLLHCSLILLALLFPQAENEEFWPDGTLKARYETIESPGGEAVPHGKYASFHENGKKHENGTFENGIRVGKWTIRWENGRRRAMGSYVNGERSGKWKLFNEKGKKAQEGTYRAGRRNGTWTTFDSKGEVDKKRSGKVEFHEGNRGSTGLRWTGEMMNGKRDGVWQCLREDGALAAIGEYSAGCPTGDWHFFLADGTFEGEWLSGRYSSCKRTGPITAVPASTQASTSRLRVDAQAEENFAAWLERPTESAAKELVKEAL